MTRTKFVFLDTYNDLIENFNLGYDSIITLEFRIMAYFKLRITK